MNRNRIAICMLVAAVAGIASLVLLPVVSQASDDAVSIELMIPAGENPLLDPQRKDPGDPECTVGGE